MTAISIVLGRIVNFAGDGSYFHKTSSVIRSLIRGPILSRTANELVIYVYEQKYIEEEK